MERHVRMEDISDGRLYDSGDLVRADCGGCEGCSACCRGMGKSIVLDPSDLHRLSAGLGKSFEELMAGYMELGVVDGMILPNLSMTGSQEACAFLDSAGRCSIHPFRPGLCRLFPLGRFYEDGGFRYFLQVKECRREKRAKIKVRRLLDVPEVGKYEKFVAQWHYFLKDLRRRLDEAADAERERQANLAVLKLFFMAPYEKERDFYSQFEERMQAARRMGL